MERNDGQQRNWLEFFAADDQRRKKRMELIDGLPIHPKAAELLKALDNLARDALARNDETAAIRIDGTVQVCVSHGDLQRELGVKSVNTVKAYVKLAMETPYFGMIPGAKNSAYNYLVRWPVIVDDPRPSARQPVGEKRRRLIPERGPVERGFDGHFDSHSDYQIDCQRGGGLEGFKTFKPSSEDQKYKSPPNPPPSLPIDCQTSQSQRRIAGDLWRRWRQAVIEANLSDPAAVDELYGIAVAFGVVEQQTTENRFRFFCQAAKALRPGPIRNPRHLFAVNAVRGNWFHSAVDEDRAARMLRAAADDAIHTRRDQERASIEVEAQELGDIERRKADQKRRLAAKHEQLMATTGKRPS